LQLAQCEFEVLDDWLTQLVHAAPDPVLQVYAAHVVPDTKYPLLQLAQCEFEILNDWPTQPVHAVPDPVLQV
jgi:hypothetical protein